MHAAPSTVIPRQMKYEEGRVLAGLPTGVRQQFLALDPLERRFILTATVAERWAYAQMAPDEQTRFARLPAPLRATYLKLSSAERVFARAVDEDALHSFLSLRPEERQAQLAQSPSAAASRDRTARLAAQASRLAHDVISRLSPWADDEPALIEAAGAAAFNALFSGEEESSARAAAMRAVLAQPRCVANLEAELSRQVGHATVCRARPVMPELLAAVGGEAQGRREVALQLTELLGRWAGRMAAQAVPLPRRVQGDAPLSVGVGLRAGFIVG